MNADRLKQIEEIYHAALEIAPDERESFFANQCGEDEDLRREVESLREDPRFQMWLQKVGFPQ